jgi:hypothetical protein
MPRLRQAARQRGEVVALVDGTKYLLCRLTWRLLVHKGRDEHFLRSRTDSQDMPAKRLHRLIDATGQWMSRMKNKHMSVRL